MSEDLMHWARAIRFRILSKALAGVMLVATAAAGAGQEDAEHLFVEANVQLDGGHFADAVAGFDKCLAADPHMLKAFFNRAIANEMVSREKAIEDWKRFAEAAQDDPDLKYLAARAQARIQLLQDMPELPAVLEPSRYTGPDGDFYRLVAPDSDGIQWRKFPVKVYLGSAPAMRWQEGTRAAFDIWRAVFPLQLVVDPRAADIRLGWQESVDEQGHAGEELDWVIYDRQSADTGGRRVAIITVDLSRPWSKDEMQAIMLHEFGHALGMKG
ncbi:MAG TPA: matrixin family metalloprotease, partial [Terriglobia bacterium]|nr:matrixin family metalloprotease [Terriglobia bacterium]